MPGTSDEATQASAAPFAPSEDALKAVRTLARASRALERASGDLSLAQYRILSAIASGNEQASKVAARLAIGKPTVSATVEVLCQRGLLDRSGAPGDQRAVVLTLTTRGKELLDEAEAKMTARIADLCALTPDPAQVLRSLAWLGDALDRAHRLSPEAQHRQAATDEGPRAT
ncbi:MAG: MarR family winged helix-turn-helix transcriptional regulator [Acidimicrobiales bacterium]